MGYQHCLKEIWLSENCYLLPSTESSVPLSDSDPDESHRDDTCISSRVRPSLCSGKYMYICKCLEAA